MNAKELFIHQCDDKRVQEMFEGVECEEKSIFEEYNITKGDPDQTPDRAIKVPDLELLLDKMPIGGDSLYVIENFQATVTGKQRGKNGRIYHYKDIPTLKIATLKALMFARFGLIWKDNKWREE